jgi:hypothetical protein
MVAGQRSRMAFILLFRHHVPIACSALLAALATHAASSGSVFA